LQEYAASIDWVNKNPAEAGALVGKKDLGIPADVAVVAIPRCNIRYMSAMDAKPAVDKYLQILLDFSPNTVGGKLPDANFFFQK
ncbi:MAG: ABC transporter substrate-binding protein, partial [Syntrophomonadaceae bacterium]|nr:ABC transporter substrate-binding protein [Syntrophomonadaceae bacterium]